MSQSTVTPRTDRPVRRATRTLAIGLFAALVALLLVPQLASTAGATALDSSFGPTKNIWIDRDALRSLPTSGTPWNDLAATAKGDWGTVAIIDQDSHHDVATFAGALYAVRMNDVDMRQRVVSAIEAAVGTEDGGRTLALGRNLTGYVLAADLVGHRSSRFEQWLRDVRTEVLDSRTLISTHEDRPNNWGTHAGTARMVAALYLGDTTDFARATTVFRGFLGDRSAYAGFRYGDLAWQGNQSKPVGINGVGATVNGVNVDGVLPDDQRRCECVVSDPPSKENYVWEAMQGVVAQATILARHGSPDVWTWSDAAIRRAVTWLHVTAKYPAEGDDTFLPFLIDAGLGTTYSKGVVASSGKSLGFTDWTHAAGTTTISTTSTTSSTSTTSTTTTSTTTTSTTSTTVAPSTDDGGTTVIDTSVIDTTVGDTTVGDTTLTDTTETLDYVVVSTWGPYELRLYPDGTYKTYKNGEYDGEVSASKFEKKR